MFFENLGKNLSPNFDISFVGWGMGDEVGPSSRILVGI